MGHFQDKVYVFLRGFYIYGFIPWPKSIIFVAKYNENKFDCRLLIKVRSGFEKKKKKDSCLQQYHVITSSLQ